MILGLGLGAPFSHTAILGAIRALFSSGEQGAWYDPSDMSTLFQDSAGTTPVTAVEQPVGRILDKSGRGNHATQATTTKRPVLSRRVNLLTESEFRNGVTDAPTRGGLISASALSGYAGAITFGYDGTTTSYAYKIATGFSSTPVTLTLVVRMDDGLAPRVGLEAGPSNDFRMLINGGAFLPVQQEISPGVYRLTASATVTSGGAQNFGVVKHGADSTKTFKVTAYDLRLATDAHLPYQRVNTATDYDADPAKYPAYLRFDGVDDTMVTVRNIDFTSTDKMTVWAGVTALDMGRSSGAVNQLLYSNGDSFNGFGLRTPSSSGLISFSSSGNVGIAEPSSPFHGTAPTNLIMCGYGDQVAPLAVLRSNGVQRAVLNIAQGTTGGYGNRTMWLASHDGTFRFLNGRLYSFIVRGAQSTLSQVEATELYVKQKMRLP